MITVNLSMLPDLQQFGLKNPKKALSISDIHQISERLLINKQFLRQYSLSQKGIIIEILSKLLFQSSHIFYDSLMSMKQFFYINDRQTTIKKNNRMRQRGNTTTVKKRKLPDIQTIRKNEQMLTIEELLQRELSSQVQSIENEKLLQISSSSRVRMNSQIKIFDEMFTNINEQRYEEQLKTPLQKIFEKSQKTQDNLQHLQDMLFPGRKNSKTKKRNTEKKKKNMKTQLLSEHVNSYIQLDPDRQSHKDQIMNILEKTKNKKNLQKQIMVFEDLFQNKDQFSKFQVTKGQKCNLKNFQKKIFQEIEDKRGIQQFSDFGSFFTDLKSKQKMKEQFKNEQIFLKSSMFFILQDELNTNGSLNFTEFANQQNLNKKDKANLFYELLCCSDIHLQQTNPQNFGSIILKQ